MLRIHHQMLDTFLHYQAKYVLSCALMMLSSMYVVTLTQESERLLQLLFQGNESYSIITQK